MAHNSDSTATSRATRVRTVQRAVALLAALAVLPLLAQVLPPRAQATTTFSFGASGDHAAGADGAAVFRKAGASGLSFFATLGDLSYDALATPPSAWCDFVEDNVNAGAGRPAGDAYGESFPFVLTKGNHEVQGVDHTDAYAAPECLPDRLGAVVSPIGTYGREHYVDHPAGAPLLRLITTAPGLDYPYTAGSPHYQWLSDAIDSARAAGIRWVAVAAHKNHITAGRKVSEISADYFNLLVAKRVDLVLQGHEHNYQRSKQLRHGPGCTVVPTGTTNTACIADDGADGEYAAGEGPVLVIDGTGGNHLYEVSSADPEAGYFTRMMGSNVQPTKGFTRISVSATALTGEYVPAAGSGFTDAFAIRSAAPDTTAPSAPVSLTATAGTNAADLSWGAASDDRSVLAYQVARDGVPLGQTAGLTWRDTPLSAGTRYRYEVTAVDLAGNRSAPAAVEVTTTRATSSVTLRATDDATVRQDLPSTNYGTATSVGADGSPVTHFLAKFTVATGQSVTGARLRLYVTNPSDRSGEVRLALGNAWSEGTVTWNTAPAAGSTVLAGGAAVATGTWVEFDVSRAVTADGTYSFRVTNPSWDGVQYASDEAAANRPELVVASAPSTAAVRVPPTADATVKQASPTTNYGASTVLEVDNSPVEHALARFDVSGTGGRPVLKAVLRLYCTNGSVSGGTVRPASPTWSERDVTWSTAPAGGTAVASLGAVTTGTWVEVDVTSAVKGDGSVGFRMDSTSSDGADYSSAQATTNRPELVVTLG